MSSTWGTSIKISIFGESHGPAIGVVIDGFEHGLHVDKAYIAEYMQRRAPGQALTTKRYEPDIPRILSGVCNDTTEGSPICAIIENQSQKSSDYSNLTDDFLPRPNHADYPAYVKYNGCADLNGGGHYSGRLTAPLVFAGALCMLALKYRKITIGAHISRIKNITDSLFDSVNLSSTILNQLKQKDFPAINSNSAQAFTQIIQEAQSSGDSVGAEIECAIIGLPVGLGDHIFDSIESKISSIIFGIPAIKSIEFGAGTNFANMTGSEANDIFTYNSSTYQYNPSTHRYKSSTQNVSTRSNNCGGILGGMATGMPVIFKVAIKPTPSIFKAQDTVNLTKQINDTISISGRHDPCIAVRAVPVIECAAAIAIYDLIRCENK